MNPAAPDLFPDLPPDVQRRVDETLRVLDRLARFVQLAVVMCVLVCVAGLVLVFTSTSHATTTHRVALNRAAPGSGFVASEWSAERAAAPNAVIGEIDVRTASVRVTIPFLGSPKWLKPLYVSHESAVRLQAAPQAPAFRWPADQGAAAPLPSTDLHAMLDAVEVYFEGRAAPIDLSLDPADGTASNSSVNALTGLFLAGVIIAVGALVCSPAIALQRARSRLARHGA